MKEEEHRPDGAGGGSPGAGWRLPAGRAHMRGAACHAGSAGRGGRAVRAPPVPPAARPRSRPPCAAAADGSLAPLFCPGMDPEALRDWARHKKRLANQRYRDKKRAAAEGAEAALAQGAVALAAEAARHQELRAEAAALAALAQYQADMAQTIQQAGSAAWGGQPRATDPWHAPCTPPSALSAARAPGPRPLPAQATLAEMVESFVEGCLDAMEQQVEHQQAAEAVATAAPTFLDISPAALGSSSGGALGSSSGSGAAAAAPLLLPEMREMAWGELSAIARQEASPAASQQASASHGSVGGGAAPQTAAPS